MAFDYQEAFKRNLGFISSEEQKKLRQSRIAIAGLGGVGAAQLHALVRLGIGKFTLADLDTYELSNFNRQLGSSVPTIGRKKIEVLREMVLSVNPEAEVRLIEKGVATETLEAFIKDADIVIDSLDSYCFAERKMIYREARKRWLWVLTTPPIGFGTSLAIFDPQGMSFEDYFDIKEGLSKQEMITRLFLGLMPFWGMLKYLDMKYLGLADNRLPCISPAFFIAAGMSASAVLNLLLKRVPPQPIPAIHQWDGLLQRHVKRYYPFGMRSPLQRLKLWIAKKMVLQSKQETRSGR